MGDGAGVNFEINLLSAVKVFHVVWMNLIVVVLNASMLLIRFKINAIDASETYMEIAVHLRG